MADGFQLLPWQSRACQTPLDADLFLGGGRGGGKTYALAALILQFVTMVPGAPILVTRRTFPGLQDIIGLTLRLFPLADPGARYSSQTHTWRFSNGSTVELGILDSEADFARYQGRSFSMIAVDEAGQYPVAKWIDLLRSCLRAPRGQPVRMVLAANPGGPGHWWLFRRFVLGRQPWAPFVEETGRTCITIPSTFADNGHLDPAAYEAQLRAATSGDSDLFRAWSMGDWHVVAGGSYFGEVLEESRVMIDNWDHLPTGEVPREHLPDSERFMFETGRWDHRPWPAWRFYLAHDFGSSAPAVTYLVAESPGTEGPDGRYYPRGSLVLVDEHDTRVNDDDFSQGNGMTVPDLAAAIRRMCNYWKAPPSGVADDAIFARHGGEHGSIAREFSRSGVHFRPARKGDRIQGWERMRTLLSQAGSLDRPGLYVSRRCTGWWATVPFLTRDSRRREDVDSKLPDHWADACRYAISRDQQSGLGAVVLPWASR